MLKIFHKRRKSTQKSKNGDTVQSNRYHPGNMQLLVEARQGPGQWMNHLGLEPQIRYL